jgi:hypothetical protein
VYCVKRANDLGLATYQRARDGSIEPCEPIKIPRPSLIGTSRYASALADEWNLGKLRNTFKKRYNQGLARDPCKEVPGHLSLQEIPSVREDDVCIHVVGPPATLTKEAAFSGVYGIANSLECGIRQIQTSRLIQNSTIMINSSRFRGH